MITPRGKADYFLINLLLKTASLLQEISHNSAECLQQGQFCAWLSHSASSWFCLHYWEALNKFSEYIFYKLAHTAVEQKECKTLLHLLLYIYVIVQWHNIFFPFLDFTVLQIRCEEKYLREFKNSWELLNKLKRYLKYSKRLTRCIVDGERTECFYSL